MSHSATTNKLHVLHVIHSSSGGGTENTLMELLRSEPMKALRHSVIVTNEPKELYPETVTTLVLPKRSRFDFRLARLKAEIADLKPDLIHCWSETLALPVVITARRMGIPCIVAFRNRYSPFVPYDVSLYLAALLCRSVSTNVPAECQHGLFRMKGLARVTCIENGVAERFFVSDPARSNRDIRFLLAGRLVEQKRPELALGGFLDYCDAGGKGYLDIVGDGHLREGLEVIASNSKSSDRIVFHGWQGNLAPFFENALAVISMSVREGMPNVLLEASAAGRISICSTIPAHKQFFGIDWPYLVKNDTTASVCDGLMAAANLTDQQRLTLGLTLQERVRANTWQQTAEKYLHLYSSC
jgi:glycosyltransferase involved in cell wall biosynthesis